MGREQSITTLNSFLRAEIAAVETYLRALGRLGRHQNEAELRACLASHERRIELLRDRVETLGGEPAEGPGAWGERDGAGDLAWAALGVGADLAAIMRLEAGEDDGLRRYLDEVCKLDQESRRQIEREILPEQVRTHDSLTELVLGAGEAMGAGQTGA